MFNVFIEIMTFLLALNEDHEKQKKDLSKLLQVNNGIVNSTPIT